MRIGSSSSLIGSSLVASSLDVARRYQMSRVPNKGVRDPGAIPDRLKDAISYFGNASHNVVMEDTPFVPQDKRQSLVRETMAMHQNMKSATKLDRFRSALQKAGPRLGADPAWDDVSLFLRTTEFCSEIERVESDVFPKGSKLWLELEHCEERRRPLFMKLPNGMLVVPVFSFEEYQDFYFSRADVYEACWFPVPRMGSRYEAFCKMTFPVCGLGPMANFCALATMALPEASQFGILINPGQRYSKFLTYPEMVHLAKQKKNSVVDNAATAKYHLSLRASFDTSKMTLTRLTPEEAIAHSKKRPAIPQVAQLELHLLLYSHPEISFVYVRTVKRPAWRKFLGSSDMLTQIDIVVQEGGEGTFEKQIVQQKIAEWSFMKEFQTDVHVEFTKVAPAVGVVVEGGAVPPMLLYDGVLDGGMLRSLANLKGMSLKESLDYDAPLIGSDGKTIPSTD